MTLLSVGVDHEHVSLALLERVTIPEENWGKALAALCANPNIDEAVLVSTCLRTEVYASIDRFHGAVEEITATLADAVGLDGDELTDTLTIFFDRGVVSHLFAVTAGLKSAVPGEYEVLGQIRRAYECAQCEGTAGPELSELFRRAIATGRRVRNETAISRGTTSFAQATVDLAQHEIAGGLGDARVVVLGAGQLASGVVRCLLDTTPRPTAITVINRSPDRATALVTAVADSRVSSSPLAELVPAVASATLLIAAVGSPQVLLHRRDLEGRTDHLLVIDLGVPRVVSTDVDDLAPVRRLDISHLRDVVERTFNDRRDAIADATSLLDADVARFHDERRARGAASIVSDLREGLERLRTEELQRQGAALATLSDEQREMVDALTKSLVAKIAHAPTVALKDAVGTDRGHRLTDAARSLFDL